MVSAYIFDRLFAKIWAEKPSSYPSFRKILSGTRGLNLIGGGLITCLLLSQGCAKVQVAPVVPPAPVPEPYTHPVAFKLAGEKGRVELATNCSTTNTDIYVDDNLRERKTEGMDFKVQTTTTDVGSDGTLKQILETTEKDGEGDLHDYAYPEPGEKLDMTFTASGNVLHAGSFPKDSVFYLPPIPFPDHAIAVDEKWTNVNKWMSDVNGVPLTVTLHSHYLGPKVCGAHMCANVEVAGEVHMPAKLEKRDGFTHTLTGRYLFDPKMGLLVWSEFVSDEQLRKKEVRAVVHSTLRSVLVEPPGFRTENHEEPSCPFETKE